LDIPSHFTIGNPKAQFQMPPVRKFAPVLIVSLLGVAAIVSFVPPAEDFAAVELMKECRTLREHARVPPTAVLPAEMDAACKRVGF
jgi:hypothetical protein